MTCEQCTLSTLASIPLPLCHTSSVSLFAVRGAAFSQTFIDFNWRINGSHYDWRFAMTIVFWVANSIYSGTWDLLLDWGLFKPNSKHPFLRPELSYSDHVPLYYIAMVSDILLRFSWVLYIFNSPGLSVPMRGWIVGILEIFRRWQWCVALLVGSCRPDFWLQEFLVGPSERNYNHF